jgi:hypothetical protein
MRYSEIKLVESKILNEGARIDHAEDIVFWEGSRGAARALDSLKRMEEGGHQDVTVKWDGSPAIIFGRNENGEFILTDKSGFGAKGYDGRSKSADALQKMLMARPGASNPDPKKAENYAQFTTNMKDIFDEYQKATPKNFRGYLKGDLLYFNTPEIQEGKYIFTPNIVSYKVDVNSDLGKKIGQSKSGIVVHRMVNEQGQEGPVPANFQMEGTEVLLFPSVTVQEAPKIEDEDINSLKAIVSRNGPAIDKMLDVGTLTQLKIKDLPTVFYNYTNNKVDTGLEDLGVDFIQWLGASNASENKKRNIGQYISQNKQAFDAMWTIVTGIMKIKDKIIKQFDSHDSTVKSSIGPHGPAAPDTHGEGGEGYVLAHPKGDIKLVPRQYFTKANRSVQR